MLKKLARVILADEMQELQLSRRIQANEIGELGRAMGLLEESRHLLIEQMRYLLESVGDRLSATGAEQGASLREIGYSLPYLLSNRRTWKQKPEAPHAGGHLATVFENARAYCHEAGFELPKDPIEAVSAMLWLSMNKLRPLSPSLLTGLRTRYPLEPRTDLHAPSALESSDA